MSWSQVSEGRWERPATGMEHLKGSSLLWRTLQAPSSLAVVNLRSALALMWTFKSIPLEAPELEDALRYAWKQLRYEQPQIAVTSEGFNKVYEVPDEASVQSWLDKTFIVSDEADGDAIGNEASPIEQATLYYVPKASQLVIRVSHSLIDGIGMVLLWDSYLRALMSPKTNLVFGEEATRLPPSLEKALGHPDVQPPEVIAKGGKLVVDVMSQLPGIGPVSRIGTTPAGPTQRREFMFSEQATNAVVQACRRNGYSVTAAIHAAFALTVVKHADPAQTTDETKYITVNSFNLRSHLPEPYSSTAAAFFYSIWPLVLKRPDNFKDLVRVIDEHYKTAYEGNPENLAEFGALTNCLCQGVQSPDFWAAPPMRDALITSLGVIERHLNQSYASADNSKCVTVESFKLGTEIILGQSMFFFYTFRNRLRMVFSFNESYEDESDIKTYLEDVEKLLLAELVV